MRVAGWMAALGAACGSTPAAAQTASADGFSLSGSTRVRAEAIDGQARAGFNTSDELLNLRTTVMAQYRDGPVRLVAELWDSRVHGDEQGTPVTTGEVNAVELVQAFAEVRGRDLLGSGSSATLAAGRFVLNLGSRRLVAADDYRNTTNGYTGLRGDFVGKTLTVTAYAVTPQIRLPEAQGDLLDNRQRLDKETNDTLLWGGLVNRKLARGAQVEFGYVGFREEDAVGRPTRDRDLDNLTARLLRNPAPLAYDFDAEVGHQTGSTSSSAAAGAPRLDVSASFVHVRAGYTFADAWKTHLSLEYDWTEGDDAGPTYRRFDTLFGMRRADFAPGGLYSVTHRANSVSPGVRWEATFTPRWDAMVVYHPTWLASDTDAFATTGVRDPTGRAGSFAGHELDARARYWLIPAAVRLEAIYIALDKGRFLREAPNAPKNGRLNQYLSLNLTATF